LRAFFQQEETVPLYLSPAHCSLAVLYIYFSAHDSTQWSVQDQSFDSPHSFPDNDPHIPHQQPTPCGPTRFCKAFALQNPAGPRTFLPPTNKTKYNPVTVVRLESITRMSTERRVLIAKKACTRCSTQKRRCDKAIPNCGLCTRYHNEPCRLVLYNMLTRMFVDSVKHANMNSPGRRPRVQLPQRPQGQSYFSAQGRSHQATSRMLSSKNLGPLHQKIPSQPTAEQSSHGFPLFRYPGCGADSH
jgi:hypothetical protein